MTRMRQVAIQIDSDVLAEVDVLAARDHRSRAEVIRVALGDWLAHQREAAVDVALARGYGERPPGREEEQWAELSVEGLKAAELDW
jgi:predicted transcriptional regulator